MQWVKVDDSFFEDCEKYGANQNNQLLHNEQGRPSVLIARLKYRGKLRDFIVPMKSNINASEDPDNYFSLPPSNRTKDGFHHGIYYIKLFPISRKYIHPYLYDRSQYLRSIKSLIDEPQNTKRIISACQAYLERYQDGNHHRYTPDIDRIIDMIDKEQLDG